MAKTKRRPSARKVIHTGRRPARAQSRIELRRILVPIDFSDHSKKALQYAIPFAGQFKSSIDLLYVVEPTIYPADFSFGQVGLPSVEDELRQRGEEELKALIKNEIGTRVKARFAVRTGKAFNEIDQYARAEGIDLVIIATHGHSGMEHVLFGSTAEKVVRYAPCPVLVVRLTEKEFVK
ncbi:MAG TPA: universal stress protein [Bacteroidetes bacterium]|nr:universal stress protein [Bacteroidota bacterium]